jgi:hypothetical protein
MESDQYPQFLNDFKTKDGQKIEVPIEGALGLLALGDIGLIAWRLKKKEKNNKNNVS